MIGRTVDREPLWRMVQAPIQREQFARCVEAQLDRLYRTALRLTRNPHDAEDLVAETVTRAWSSVDSLQDPDRVGAWFVRIMTNHFISERRRAVHRTVHEEYVEEAGDGGPAFSIFERLHQPILLWWGNPEQQFLDQLVQEDIAAALEELPEVFRVVIVLADVEGMKYQEIAETLDVPVGTVRSRLARARSMMQKSLWQHALDQGLVAEPPIEAK